MKSKILLCAGILLAISATASAAPLISNGLILYYSFDNFGTSVPDGSGNSYHGTVMNDVTYSPDGVLGGCAGFTDRLFLGIEPETERKLYRYNYIDLPVGDIYAGNDIPTNNFTVAAWYNISPKQDIPEDDDNQYQPHEVFSSSTWIPGSDQTKRTLVVHTELRPAEGAQWGTPSPDYRFVLRDRADDPGGSANKYTIGELRAKVEGTDGFYEGWHHVAMSYDHEAKIMSIYRDGVLVGENKDCNDYTMADSWDAGASIGATPDGTRQLLGQLDEFTIYKTTLSAGAIYAMAHTTLVGDANCDGSVDLLDLTILGGNWRGTEKEWLDGDFNDDGMVDLLDLTILGGNWRNTGISWGEALKMVSFSNQVPEPGAFVLLATAAVGLAAAVVRRRRHK